MGALEKNYATDKEMLQSGMIMRAYGSTHLISVNPCLDIHKVRISIVKLGTKGKDCDDVYLSVAEFLNFCNQVDSYQAAKKFAADMANPYPKAYLWTKGKNGAKKLAVGGGQKGVRFQTTITRETGGISADGKAQVSTAYKLCVCSYEQLQSMSFYFKLIIGMVQFISGSYLDDLYKAYWTGAKERTRIHSNYDESTDGDFAQESAPEEEPAAEQPKQEEKPKAKPTAKAKTKEEAPAPVKPEAKPEEKKEAKPEQPKAEKVTDTFLTQGSFWTKEGHYFIKGVQESTGLLITLGFPKPVIAQISDTFEAIKVEAGVAEQGKIAEGCNPVRITLTGVLKETCFTVKELA